MLDRVNHAASRTSSCCTCAFLRARDRASANWTPEQLFSVKEQELFTRALASAEKRGKSIHLAVAPATEKWDGILRAAQSLAVFTIALGLSSSRRSIEEARIAGLAWEAPAGAAAD